MDAKENLLISDSNRTGFVKPNGYLVVIETTKSGFSAFCPDLQGCITVGKTIQQTRSNIQEAIELYLEELVESGAKLPAPQNVTDYINTLGNTENTYLTFIHVPTHMTDYYAKSA